jgi:glycine hydroxymethyltransferase
MNLSHGGHLTHGSQVNFSGKTYQFIHYGVEENGFIDMNKVKELAEREKPKLIICGYTAYPRKIDFAAFQKIAEEVGAIHLADISHISGLIVAGAHPSPFPHADIVMTTTHKTLRGPRGGLILCKEEFKDMVNKGCPLVLGGPLPHVMAAKAIAFKEASQPQFQKYAHQIVLNAKALANHLLSKGVKLYTGGTDNHLIVMNVQASFGINGRQAENLLREAKITANRNTVPFDPNGPWYTSGVRIGTPALTTLGMKEKEMELIGDLIVDILSHTESVKSEKTGEISKALRKIRPEVKVRSHRVIEEMLQQYPLYPEIRINVGV